MASLLIVDDNPHMRTLARTVAEQSGWDVAGEAEDGEQAVRCALSLLPDLVLMDYHLPATDGVTATTRIKSSQPRIAVLAWSSSDDPAVCRRFLAAGADAHLLKADLAGLQAALARQRDALTEPLAS
jgi:two-component system NarL family response regulator